MSTRLAPPKRFVKAYHHHQHLLLQFIWTELILASQEIERAQKACASGQMEQEPKALYQALAPHLTRLAGSPQDYMRLFDSDDDGIFNKLKNYALLFSLQDPSSQKKHAIMIQEASNAWLNAVQALGLLRTIAHQTAHVSQKQTAKLSLFIEKTQRSTLRLINLTAQITSNYKNDENVIFFLLRHQKSLNALRENQFILSLLKKMFRENLETMRKFLVKRYSERGFIHLLPFINQSVEQLQTS